MKPAIERINYDYTLACNLGVKPVRIRMSPHVHAELLEEARKISGLLPKPPEGQPDLKYIAKLWGLPVIIDQAEPDFTFEVEL